MELFSMISIIFFSHYVSAQIFPVQSKPFHLILLSQNTTINNTPLAACHAGAGIESLCLTNFSNIAPTSPSPFTHNTSTVTQPSNDTIGKPGYLVYTLNTGNSGSLSSPLGLSYDPASNVALPLFYPGEERV